MNSFYLFNWRNNLYLIPKKRVIEIDEENCMYHLNGITIVFYKLYENALILEQVEIKDKIYDLPVYDVVEIYDPNFFSELDKNFQEDNQYDNYEEDYDIDEESSFTTPMVEEDENVIFLDEEEYEVWEYISRFENALKSATLKIFNNIILSFNQRERRVYLSIADTDMFTRITLRPDILEIRYKALSN